DIKGMHKVPVRLVGNPFEQGTGPLDRHIIPTHMRHLQPLIGSKSSDLAGDHAEPLVSPKFLTFLKQQLEPQADSEKWFSRLNRCTNRFHQPIALNIVHAIAKGPDTRQDDMTRIPDHTRITRDHRLMPHRLKGLGDTAEIAHAIVDNRNHASNPLWGTNNNTPMASLLPL